MEAAAVLRSFRGGVRTKQPSESFLEKPAVAHVSNVSNVALKTPFSGGFMVAQGWNRTFLPYLKASKTNSVLTSEDRSSQEPLEKISVQNSTFPIGFEALILEVCDETNIAEFKIKIGDFEMHLKRDIESPRAPSPGTHIVSPTTAPPIPSQPMNESGAAAQPVVSQKSPTAATSPFANISSAKASKLVALEASASNAYVLVSSPTVGTFQRGRTLKGKKQPPSCKEGDVIKEGQIIGFLDQFGNELPVKSDVAGEVVKVLCQDGEAVGYGDPLVAVLPSFHGIE
ncbi:biotin carboxyl carrier protein of acetyl-CoA carboxylase isoform X2 [Phoenix dactylifera]|uniref:Biotin carboxyl carrier protein of acetyl-CoA carboxylase isoform X2 n=1 Tax=Phoenix dactylifera TaxID=42345 RepID=A0A8B7C1T6_PHODC|nr:biotin carboxyl carrier protein of acetyl-CoA carboxylase isoform X2 [Phoenix dactylifera]